MSITWLNAECSYDGTQLSTDFIKQHGSGSDDEIVLFLGPADVPVEHLVDLEDAAANAVIQSPMMAHVLLEHRGVPLTEMVWRQRMLGRIASSWIVERTGIHVDVKGDDLFIGDGKLSVSVATRSNRSSLIHFAVNVESGGAPVKTSALRDLRIPPKEFLMALARAYEEEALSAARATQKVKPVS